MGGGAAAALTRFLEETGFHRDDTLLHGGVEALRTLGFVGSEIEAVPKERVLDLALQRVAMLDVEK